VLERAAGRAGHIFNLGHGVLPGTDPDVLGRLVELVHSRSAAPGSREGPPPRAVAGGLAGRG
jgi:uroporphyrinogen decarboxylase